MGQSFVSLKVWSPFQSYLCRYSSRCTLFLFTPSSHALSLLGRRIKRHSIALDDALDLAALEHLRESLVDELQKLFLLGLDHPCTVPAHLGDRNISFRHLELGLRVLEPSLRDGTRPQHRCIDLMLGQRIDHLIILEEGRVFEAM